MKASLLYRIASVLLFLFALGHTVGFRQHDPQWGVEPVLGLMQSVHFNVQGFNRTYWDVFVGLASLSPCFSYSPRYSRGNSAAFQQKLWLYCGAPGGRSHYALLLSRS